jgi:glycosyltransferase involved in cell wall biosynthesis
MIDNKKLIMVGLANNKTSLGEVFRRYVKCFDSFCKPDVFDLQPYIKNENMKIDLMPSYKGAFDHDVKYFHPSFHLYQGIKRQTKPSERNEKVKKIGYFVWESSELHDKDADTLKDFDEVWTASEYCKGVFEQYIDPSCIKVIPHPIPFPKTKPKKYKKFTLLIMGNISSNINRKNLEANIEVAKIIAKKYKNINVILKTFTLNDKEKSILKKLVDNSKIKVIDEYFSSQKTQELIGKSHMILSLHRSEGFGLTLAEAMAVDTIPVATGYSGNLQFMKDEDLLVDYKLVDVTDSYFRGQWAEPDIHDAIDKIDNAIKNKKEIQSIDFLSYSNISNLIKENI